MESDKKRKTRSYTEEFKQSSVKLAIESDQAVAATARNLGVHEGTLHGWIQKHYTQHSSANKMQGGTDALVELKRLKKENIRLKMERDILKKAAAYFASDTL